MEGIGFVIIGGTGDLSVHKIIPQFLSYFSNNNHQKGIIVACGSRFADTLEFIQYLKSLNHIDPGYHKLMDEVIHYEPTKWSNPKIMLTNVIKYLSHTLTYKRLIFYICVNNTSGSYISLLCKQISSIVNEHHYNIKKTTKLNICIEKPCGNSFEDAVDTLSYLEKLQQQHNNVTILYVDHFLHKNSFVWIKNILYSHFHPIVSCIKQYKYHIYVAALETIDVEKRKEFWETSGGIVPDMFQSHLLLMLKEVLVSMGITTTNSLSLINHQLYKYNGYNGKNPTMAILTFTHGNSQESTICLHAGKKLSKKHTLIEITWTEQKNLQKSTHVLLLQMFPDPQALYSINGIAIKQIKMCVEHDNSYYNIMSNLVNQNFNVFVSPEDIINNWKILLPISRSSTTCHFYTPDTELVHKNILSH